MNTNKQIIAHFYKSQPLKVKRRGGGKDANSNC